MVGSSKGNKRDMDDKVVCLKIEVGVDDGAGLLKWLQPAVSGPIYDGS